LKVGANEQEEESGSDIDLYTTDEEGQFESEVDSDEDCYESEEECSEEEEESVSPKRNWWDDYGSDSE